MPRHVQVGMASMYRLMIMVALMWAMPLAAANDCTVLAPSKGSSWTLNGTPSLVTDNAELPAYCQVRGIAVDRIQFELRLPLAEAWNGGFLLAGCGGFCGQLLPDKPGHSNTINPSLKRGYAAMAHDSGHQTDSSADTNWARGDDPLTLELWAHRLLPELVEVANELVTAYYQQPPSRRLFSGCSNGGRLGLIAAQRYPELFDGIAAGGPILDLSGNAGVQGAWMIQQAWMANGLPRFTAAQIERLAQQVLSSCQAQQGVLGAFIAHPDRCQPDLSVLDCAADDSPGCLQGDQLMRIAALYRGAHDGDSVLFPGLPPGSEHLWPFWITGQSGNPAWGALAAQGFLDIYRSMPPGQSVSALDIDVVAEAQAMADSPLARMANAIDADLSRWRAVDGKLLVWHGWADPLISPQRTIRYFEEAAIDNGGAEALSEHARLFMVAGHGHCWEASGLAPDLFDPVQVLEEWIEQGEAPKAIVAGDHFNPRQVSATALLCPHPQHAVHDGRGPKDRAESYRCEPPKANLNVL